MGGQWFRRLVDPESQLDDDARARMARESAALNGARMRRFGPIVLAAQLFTVLFYRLAPTPSLANERLWLEGLTRVHTGVLALDLACFGLIYSRWGRTEQGARRVAEVTQFGMLLGYALVAANAQRTHGSLGAFMAMLVVLPFLLQTQVRAYVMSVAIACAALCTGAALLQHSSPLWLNAVFTALAMSGFGVILARSHAEYRARDVVNRRALEELNQQLERRVQVQVHEIIARAEQIERLNDQLAAQVRSRSRELSMALLRLARGISNEDEVMPGALLGGRVEVRAALGSGAAGLVFRGFDRVSNHEVAVKIVQAATVRQLDALQRFLREAELLATVEHPAIVRSLHVDVSDDGRLFQILELIEGVTLEQVLVSEGALEQGFAALLGAVAADALAATHEAGVVHCDVKPANLMLTATAPHVRLVDFGISRVRNADLSTPELTNDGVLLGTPQYMAPEQVLTPDDVAPPADVYALGVTLYRTLAAKFPFDAKSVGAWLQAHATAVPTELREARATVDAALAASVMRCLSRDANARPTARALSDELSAHARRLGATPLTEASWLPREVAARAR